MTGPWIAGLGLTAVLISKEIYILNAEVRFCVFACHWLRSNDFLPTNASRPPQTLLGAIAGTTLYFLVREIGKPTAEYLDNRAKVNSPAEV